MHIWFPLNALVVSPILDILLGHVHICNHSIYGFKDEDAAQPGEVYTKNHPPIPEPVELPAYILKSAHETLAHDA